MGRKSSLLLLLVLVAVFLVFLLPPSASAAVAANTGWGQMPPYFIANQGQLDGSVSYYVRGADKTLYFTPQGVTFALAQPGALPRPEGARAGNAPTERWVVKLGFLGASPVTPTGQARTPTLVSYFTGAPDEWQTGLPTYSSLVYTNLWPGIDLAYTGAANQLKHEFVVEPGADPNKIRLRYQGADVTLDQMGQLQVSTPFGSFTDEAPVAYQEVDGERVTVSASYALETSGAGAGQVSVYGFTLGAYDLSLPLIIDPVVRIYCGFIGGSGEEFGCGIAVDSVGHALVTGYTSSGQTSFPETFGPDLTYNGGSYDAFVAKVNTAGTALLYCSYLGGAGDDYGESIAVDSAGNAYVTGRTSSGQTSFPVLLGPDLTYNGGSYDAFVAKVKWDGTTLLYCGYVGGNGYDHGYGIAVDSAGSAYVTGTTTSPPATFPIAGGLDPTINGGADAFVAKVNVAGTGLDYAGYLGGSGEDYGSGIALDSAGNAYVTGSTSSAETSFPVTGSLDPTYNGGTYDAFVAKVNTAGSALAYCGYLGGSGLDYGESIAVDSAGNAYLTGWTDSAETSFPVAGSLDPTYNGGLRDAFVAKVKADGTALLYCGYFGGGGEEWGLGIAVDSAGSAYVTGYTTSYLPVANGPDLTFNGYDDAFVTKVNAAGTGLDYAGYLGGTSFDFGVGIAVDSAGNAYVTGHTYSDQTSFPVLAGPDLTFNGDCDAFVAKIGSRSAPSAFNDGSLANQPGPVTLNVVANDTDPDNDLAPASVDLDPNTAGQQTSLFAPGGEGWGSGTWSADAGGNVTFTPPPMQPNDPCYDPLPIFYRVSDETLLVSNLALITVDYVHAPIATDDSSSGNLPGPVTVDVLANDTRGGQTNPVTVDVDPSTAGQQTLRTVAGEGTWSANTTTGAITFTPLVGFIGDPTPIFYTVEDYDLNISNQARVTVTYTIPTRYQQTESYLGYAGTWTAISSTAASAGSYARTNVAGASVTVKFTGSYLAWVTVKAANRGIARVFLDGVDKGTVDLYSATTVWQQRVWKTPVGMASGTHTIRIEYTGTKRTAATGTYIDLDCFDVIGTLVQAPRRYQQTESYLGYAGTWTAPKSTSASAGNYARTNVAGASVTVKFTGSYLAWVTVKAANRGIARVFLDGVDQGTVDLYSATTVWQQSVWMTPVGMASGTHTIRIEHTGTKRTAATGTYIDLDCFDVIGTLAQAPRRYQQTESRLSYAGTWAAISSTSASAGSYARTNVAGASVTVKFTGSYLAWVTVKAANRGIARVFLDGVDKGTVDLYNATTVWQQRVWKTPVGMASGTHTIRIEHTGTKRAASTGTYIDLDCFDVIGTLVSSP